MSFTVGEIQLWAASPGFLAATSEVPRDFLAPFFSGNKFFLAHICYYFQLFLFDNNVFFFLFKSTKYIMSFLSG
jgi:hypothetical protein